MDLTRKTQLISIALVSASIALAVVLYLLFKILFLFIIIAPPLIYSFLRRRQGNGDGSIDGAHHV